MKTLLVLITATLLLVVAGIAYASIPDSNGVIHACYSNPPATHGSPLNIIDSATGSCGGGKAEITWNQTGPTGPRGATGAQGPPATPYWASLNAAGQVNSASHLVSVTHPTTGNYLLTWDTSIVNNGADCAWLATMEESVQGGPETIQALSGSGRIIIWSLRDSWAGVPPAPVDSSFSVGVFC